MKCVGMFALLLAASPLLRAEEMHHPHGESAYSTASPAADIMPPTTAAQGVAPAATGHAPMHDHMQPSRFTWLKVDELEAVDSDAGTTASWDAALSWGGAFDRLWLRTEGEREDGHSGNLETQLYWSHAVARWWDTTLGLRHDNGAGPSRSWAAVGLRGLAPYWFETEATAFVGEEGDTALRLEAEYELLLTNRLILQPQLELNFYGNEDAAHQQGRGLAESEAGLRLRYEIRREFAPYVGVTWQRLHGTSSDLAQAAGERVHEAEILAGLRFWY